MKGGRLTEIVRETLSETGKQRELADALGARFGWKRSGHSAEVQLSKMLRPDTPNHFPVDGLLDFVRITGETEKILGALMEERLLKDLKRRPRRVRPGRAPAA